MGGWTFTSSIHLTSKGINAVFVICACRTCTEESDNCTIDDDSEHDGVSPTVNQEALTLNASTTLSVTECCKGRLEPIQRFSVTCPPFRHVSSSKPGYIEP